jgi:tripartite-type tricarboxylate transporter receptor subunit TctC
MKRAIHLLVFLFFTNAATVTGIAADYQNYPTKPVRLIVPFAPGGPSDIIGRLVGQKLAESLGQSVVADNRGAAGGIVGFELAARAAPDGYTLLLGSAGGLTMNPSLYLKLPYDSQRDYVPITQLTAGPNLMCVHPSVAAKSVQEFIALAKARPGQLNFASAGTGNRLASELFRIAAGISIVNVPYKGTGQAIGDLMGGQVQMMMINPVAAIPQVKAGKLRGLGVTSLKRAAVLPDTPTIAESGVHNFELVSWHAILAPANTPAPIVKRLHADIVKLLSQPDVKERFASQGLDTVGSTQDEFRVRIREDTLKYAKLIKEVGIKPE